MILNAAGLSPWPDTLAGALPPGVAIAVTDELICPLPAGLTNTVMVQWACDASVPLQPLAMNCGSPVETVMLPLVSAPMLVTVKVAEVVLCWPTIAEPQSPLAGTSAAMESVPCCTPVPLKSTPTEPPGVALTSKRAFLSPVDAGVNCAVT